MRIDRIPHHSAAIVGGGFAGALTAPASCSNEPEVPLAITIIERRRGASVGILPTVSTEPVHLVNGPTEIFSLYPEDPGHLSRWLVEENGPANGWTPPAEVSSSAVRRAISTAPMSATNSPRAVANARLGSTLRHIRSSAAALAAAPNRIRITTTNGAVVEADEEVIPSPLASSSLACRQPNPSSPAIRALRPIHGTHAPIAWLTAMRSCWFQPADGRCHRQHGGERLSRALRRDIAAEASWWKVSRTVDAARDFLADGPLPVTARELLSRVKAMTGDFGRWARTGKGCRWRSASHSLAMAGRERSRMAAIYQVSSERSGIVTHTARRQKATRSSRASFRKGGWSTAAPAVSSNT